MEIGKVVERVAARGRYEADLVASVRSQLAKQFNLATIGSTSLRRVSPSGGQSLRSRSEPAIYVHPVRGTSFQTLFQSVKVPAKLSQSDVEPVFQIEVESLFDRLAGLWEGQKKTLAIVDGPKVQITAVGDQVQIDLTVEAEDPKSALKAA
jgi:hypothetical protein